MKPVSSLASDHDRAVAICRALGNPARMLIVRELARQAGCVNRDFLALLPLAHSTVSGHLKVLKDAGVVGLCDDGRSYCLEPEVFDWLAQFSRGVVSQEIRLTNS